jgi:hypothetical protein
VAANTIPASLILTFGEYKHLLVEPTNSDLRSRRTREDFRWAVYDRHLDTCQNEVLGTDRFGVEIMCCDKIGDLVGHACSYDCPRRCDLAEASDLAFGLIG